MQYEVLTEVYRGKNINGRLVVPLLESVHLGMVAVVDEDGKELLSIGNTESEFYIRSAAKPFQAIPLLESGAAEHFHILSEEQIGAVRKYDPTVVLNHRKKEVGFIQSVI